MTQPWTLTPFPERSAPDLGSPSALLRIHIKLALERCPQQDVPGCPESAGKGTGLVRRRERPNRVVHRAHVPHVWRDPTSLTCGSMETPLRRAYGMGHVPCAGGHHDGGVPAGPAAGQDGGDIPRVQVRTAGRHCADPSRVSHVEGALGCAPLMKHFTCLLRDVFKHYSAVIWSL